MEPLPLRDIHLPEAIGWWPPAIGWWLLLIGVPIVASGLIWLIRRRRVSPVRLALRELDRLRLDGDLPADEKLRHLGILLRRVNLSLYPREDVAGLAGEDWLRWLDRALGAPRFSKGLGRSLIDGPYRAQPQAGVDELLALCRDWVKAAGKSGRQRARKAKGS